MLLCSLAGILISGEYFGEMSCLLGTPRAATVVAAEYSEVYTLSKAHLIKVVQQWPSLAEEFNVLGTLAVAQAVTPQPYTSGRAPGRVIVECCGSSLLGTSR